MSDLSFAAKTLWHAFVEDALGVVLFVAFVAAVRFTVVYLSREN